MKESKPFRVLLYYHYVTIEDPETFAQAHLRFCKELGLKGRILVGREGLNGTVSGTTEQTQIYMDTLHRDPRFADMPFKIDEADGHVFKKMHVRPRKEIVALKLDQDIDPHQVTGKHLKPKEFYEAIQDENVLVIDARNNYETQIGRFRNAILPDVKNFRDLPEWIEHNLADYKDKKVLTYCTGGIRCEKFSGYLLRAGFHDVSQLEGGIVEYGKDPEVKGRLYDGKCYVFDQRISVPVNRTDEDVVVGHCHHCGKTCDRIVNCANPECNKQFICCEECEHEHHRSCSDACFHHPRNRYDQEVAQSVARV
ncbi:rhodanese-related sulfurtransferase [Sporolactobacillus laevolacticus]|uniref:oxygen-dependent tRNA uridine(34) hydroxylase TrhO n=1 Tax=Sporolactobacillus laevolacticus TaxID=33018 RepID=UPI0025B60E27|nr:rhodanese-related sulfurtransferase [Sporolactobacillus laevolacticus]MDN3953856.1 rhodanese-related sulfurtransferase [Sporolactobacillus laevolacticus]